MPKLISLLRHFGAWLLWFALVWSFSIPLDRHPPHIRSTCSDCGLEGWALLTCRSSPSVLVVRCVSSAGFMWFLPTWFRMWVDGWAGAFVSLRILRAVCRGVRDPRLDQLLGHRRGPWDGTPYSQRMIWTRHNMALDVLETAASSPVG
ncbi:hypothetical protein MCOR25_005311 [Pyricularia grisea]|nr:hypothetical protein MCOR25_005311 [Pyricularia grisea]